MSGFSVPISSWLYQGIPAASGTLQVYKTGTTTHINIYADAGLTTPLSNPVTLDSNGQVKFYVDGSVNLRLDGYTASGSLIASIDPVYPVSSTAIGTVVSQPTSFTLSASNNGNNIIATAAITITLPVSTGFANNFYTQLNAQNGAITLTPNVADKIQGGTAGASYVIPQGASGELWTDANGNWGLNFLSSQIASVNGGQIAGFRNFIKNGDFKIWQRGTASTALTTSASYSTADRWGYYQSSAAASAAAQSTSVPTGLGFLYSLKIGRNNASANTNIILVGQALETADSLPLAGKPFTVSFYAKAGANYSPTNNGLSVAVPTGTGTDQSLQNGLNGGWTGYVNTALTGTNPVQLTTSWQRFSLSGSFPSNITQALVEFVMIPTGTAGADDNAYITGVQLEVGTIATPFEFRPFAIELGLCQRYYEKSFPYGTAPVQNSGSANGGFIVYQPTGATGNLSGQVQFKQTKRASPTVTTYNPSAANANWRDVTNSADRTASVGNIGDSGFNIVASSTVASSANAICWSADAEL